MSQFEGLDPKVWWRLAGEADRLGVRVRELLAEPVPVPVVVEPTTVERLVTELGSARRGGFRVPRRQVGYLEQKAWTADERRRQNLDSFRRMSDEWTEIPA